MGETICRSTKKNAMSVESRMGMRESREQKGGIKANRHKVIDGVVCVGR